MKGTEWAFEGLAFLRVKDLWFHTLCFLFKTHPVVSYEDLEILIDILTGSLFNMGGVSPFFLLKNSNAAIVNIHRFFLEIIFLMTTIIISHHTSNKLTVT